MGYIGKSCIFHSMSQWKPYTGGENSKKTAFPLIFRNFSRNIGTHLPMNFKLGKSMSEKKH